MPLALALAAAFGMGPGWESSARADGYRLHYTIPRLTPAYDFTTGGEFMAPPVPYGHYAKDHDYASHLLGCATCRLHALMGCVGGLCHHGGGGHGHGTGCGACGGKGCGLCSGPGLFGHHGAGSGCAVPGCAGGIGCGHGHHKGAGRYGPVDCGPAGAVGTAVVGTAVVGPGQALPGGGAVVVGSGQVLPGGGTVVQPSGQAACGDPSCGIPGKHHHGRGHSPCGLCHGRGCGGCAGSGLDGCGDPGCGLCHGRGRGCGFCGGKGCGHCKGGHLANLHGHLANLHGRLAGLLYHQKVDYFLGAGGPVPLTPGYVPYVVATRSPRDYFAFPPMNPNDP
jgi:hypothetical protein